MLDNAGDCTCGWHVGSKNGPPDYLKSFIPPNGWTAIGLKVNNLFDDGDNTWLGTSNVVGEWYVGYHGVKTMNSINNILFNGFRRGPGQDFKNYNNLNPLTNNLYPQAEKEFILLRI